MSKVTGILPGWLPAMNLVIAAVQRLGLSVGPVRVLVVPGRSSGRPRETPVTPIEVDGRLSRDRCRSGVTYLFVPRFPYREEGNPPVLRPTVDGLAALRPELDPDARAHRHGRADNGLQLRHG